MAEIAIRTVINAIALIAAVRLVPAVEFAGDLVQLLVVAAIFGLINAYLRPIVRLLSLPLNLFALGLVGFAINTALLLLLALVSDQLDLGLSFAGWPGGPLDADALITAFLTSLVVSIVSTLLAFVRLVVPRV